LRNFTRELQKYTDSKMPRTVAAFYTRKVTHCKIHLKKGETICESLELLAKSMNWQACEATSRELDAWCSETDRIIQGGDFDDKENYPVFNSNQRKSASPAPSPQKGHDIQESQSEDQCCERNTTSPSSDPPMVSISDTLTSLSKYFVTPVKSTPSFKSSSSNQF